MGNTVYKKKTGKKWFKGLKAVMKIKYKKPNFYYLGEEFKDGSLILSNHEGTDAPMALEIYCNRSIRFWGAHQMNSGLVQLYKYQTRVYYHEKKHWNLFLARLFCLIASPLTNMFYSGFNLISTYQDSRFLKTVKESIEAVKGGDSIVVFPEDSTNGYLAELEGFHGGFAIFAEACLKRGIDLPIVVSYYRKKDNTYIIDEPVLYSVLKKKYPKKEDLAVALCSRCNELGKMDTNKKEVSLDKKAA